MCVCVCVIVCNYSVLQIKSFVGNCFVGSCLVGSCFMQSMLVAFAMCLAREILRFRKLLAVGSVHMLRFIQSDLKKISVLLPAAY